MQIDRILFPVFTLGPNKRMAIWTQGCHKRCKSCANPELWEFDLKKDIKADVIRQLLIDLETNGQRVEGFTITGGEPLAQSTELLEWMNIMLEYSGDILLFTGYYPEEIEKLDNCARECFGLSSVVIAGEYSDEENDNKTALVASLNQKIIWNNPDVQEDYLSYMKEGRKLENVFFRDTLISVGIHNRKESKYAENPQMDKRI